MKKLLIAAIAFLGISAATFAQTAAAPKAKDAAKKTEVKAKQTTTAAKTDAAKTTATAKDATAAVKTDAANTTGTHTKKDGTLDKRYKENKAAAKPVHLKKDGTADKRFKENKKQ
jgi:hypothetical protein